MQEATITTIKNNDVLDLIPDATEAIISASQLPIDTPTHSYIPSVTVNTPIDPTDKFAAQHDYLRKLKMFVWLTQLLRLNVLSANDSLSKNAFKYLSYKALSAEENHFADVIKNDVLELTAGKIQTGKVGIFYAGKYWIKPLANSIAKLLEEHDRLFGDKWFYSDETDEDGNPIKIESVTDWFKRQFDSLLTELATDFEFTGNYSHCDFGIFSVCQYHDFGDFREYKYFPKEVKLYELYKYYL